MNAANYDQFKYCKPEIGETEKVANRRIPQRALLLPMFLRISGEQSREVKHRKFENTRGFRLLESKSWNSSD
jgi:hypothetical protein